MAGVSDIKQLVSDLNTNTNEVATRIDAQTASIQELKDKIAAGGVATQEDLDAIAEGLAPISEHLKALGADPNAPLPDVPPAE